MPLISFSLNTFNHFLNCFPDILEEEISRTSIRLKLGTPQTNEERDLYQSELDRLAALRYINQLRKGKLTREEFSRKVVLTAL